MLIDFPSKTLQVLEFLSFFAGPLEIQNHISNNVTTHMPAEKKGYIQHTSSAPLQFSDPAFLPTEFCLVFYFQRNITFSKFT